jgi:hypothetical protein
MVDLPTATRISLIACMHNRVEENTYVKDFTENNGNLLRHY